MQFGLPILPPRPATVSKRNLPPFSSLPLLFLIMIKPLTDAFYEVEAVKYGYILLLIFASIFAKIGQTFSGAPVDTRNKSLFAYIWLIAFYFAFLFGLAIIYGGTLAEIFKIISPFVFFALVIYATDRWLIYALAAGAVLTIVVNAGFLPFDYGWVTWGAVKTFKGYYFFKTDLAYALSFSVLIYAFYARNSMTPILAMLMLLAAAEVVLANSRLNYLTFACVAIFIAAKGGVSFRSMVRYSLLFALLGVVIVLLYDPTKFLGFDTSSEAGFTQGRNVTWGHLFEALANYSPVEWLFGKGAYADLIVSMENTSIGQAVHNAHNEYLHMIFTQGILGSGLYILLWSRTFRMSDVPDMPGWARGTSAIALFMFMLQGMTAVVSSFATKTWPLVMVLLALRSLTTGTDQNKPFVSPT
ncbi:hypothetical protein HYN24_08830 [Dechloromonas sp. HYN0024]|nr:hypothetical protein HYN24_08830 [Dechloromonas sp. HYN0024]